MFKDLIEKMKKIDAKMAYQKEKSKNKPKA